MAHDLASGSGEQLAPYYLPGGTNYFSFAPGMRGGVIADGRGLNEGLHWLKPEGPERMELPLVRAGAPAWSPDGRALALIGTPPEQPPRAGQDIIDAPVGLFLTDAAGQHLRPLVTGLRAIGPPTWSPDGRWLAGLMHSDTDAGLWLVDVATGRRRLVFRSAQVGRVQWLPNGRTLVVVIGRDPLTHKAGPLPLGLAVIELPDLDALPSPESG